ncbi:hypothetical protein [Paractinoplanes rishiriensis]|uniref:Uncharacterized protein n=1 Tax=Paractinoplanes rishiriensis TaxID=1050105 RepID=A0A919K7K0_9ACTN|nr:hypothetical protein [Actinoplanes rishiriensis]GIF01115.1 hypothetical protein Ari01nite_85790 [Actinoplanes rishiriensis]
MVEHRVQPHTCEIAGATLTVSTSNGYSVIYRGDYVGYIHASLGDRWNAYRRRLGTPDDHLGKFGQEEAVRRIVRAVSTASATGAAP